MSGAGTTLSERAPTVLEREPERREGQPLVHFAGVSVSYPTRDGSLLALAPLDLAFNAGDFVCVVGPSGCGKTTLMQTLAGFLKPTTGSVLVDGRAVAGPDPDRGVVFQQPALFPWMTVRQNAGFGPMVRGRSRAERREKTDHLLRLVGLDDFADRYPYQLSGGMQQRLAIARALANDPAILLLDEPFGALDALTREKMQEELHAIWQRTRMSVLFITHSVEEAAYLGTDVVVFSPRPGRIVEHVKLGFSRVSEDRQTSREIKASPPFIAVREHLLGLILADEG